jgi:ammonia channel protein AmtB
MILASLSLPQPVVRAMDFADGTVIHISLWSIALALGIVFGAVWLVRRKR